jgi:GT2 family glycosyltransferase
MADVCVTIVLYNSRDHLRECLAALWDDLDAGRIALVAVDNASPDDSADLLRQEVPQATVIDAPHNLGFAGGCNLAWERVDAPYWFLLNPDVVLDPGTVDMLRQWMDAHPDVALASPWLRDGDRPHFPGRAFPSAAVSLVELTRLHRLLPRRRRESLLQGPYVTSAPDDSPQPGWVPATAVIARSEAVRQAGAFDDDFFLYGEDIEWCWRLRRAGWRIAAAPVGGGVHHESASSRRTWDDDKVQQRIANGTLEAVARTRGRLRALLLGAIMSASLRLESWHPRRDPAGRRRSAIAARAWWRAVRP